MLDKWWTWKKRNVMLRGRHNPTIENTKDVMVMMGFNETIDQLNGKHCCRYGHVLRRGGRG